MSRQALHTFVRGTVRGVRRETPDTFTLLLDMGGRLTPSDFMPGQFNMLYVFGVGEVPISVASSRGEELLMHTIRSAGTVTNILARLRVGDNIGVRGPFGRGWPLADAEGKQLLVIAGGLGLPPLRPVIQEAIAKPDHFAEVKVLYGARTPADLIYTHEYSGWHAAVGCDLLLTVDRGTGDWKGNVGVVTTLFPKTGIDPGRAIAFICGPELMLKFSIVELLKMGVPPDRIFISLERNMSCALGTCGHCQLGPLFICRDGPVFSYAKVRGLFPREGI
ncbi:MAG TPA: FAD/NAD(P)-binding protein [Nitrososphaerales archaeon]|nr:FAD/NAD(P)-binding protein [Nitrososphaerales archaeon]